MAHELTIRRSGKVEMAYRGTVPWHGLGQALSAGASIDVWRREAGMDWTILSAPVRYSRALDNAVEERVYKDRVVLYRSDTGEPLSVVSDDYRIVQPGEVLEFFRDLTEKAGLELETAGTLYGGRRFWALAKLADETPVLDPQDKVKGYLLLSTSADGSLATSARFTSIRVVCNNTLTWSTQTDKAKVTVTHRATFKHDEAKQQLGLLSANAEKGRSSFREAMDTFRRLARTQVKPIDMVRLTVQAVLNQNPDTLGQEALEKALDNRAVKAICELSIDGTSAGANLAGSQGTGWGWLNAVTQYVDHHAGARSDNNRLDSAWFGRGNTIKTRALELAMAHADGRTVTYAEAPDTAPDGSGGLLSEVLAATPQAA